MVLLAARERLAALNHYEICNYCQSTNEAHAKLPQDLLVRTWLMPQRCSNWSLLQCIRGAQDQQAMQ